MHDRSFPRVTIAVALSLLAAAVAAALANGDAATAGADTPGYRPVAGVAVGVVVDARDPQDLGRVKLKFPWLSGAGQGESSFWARVAVPLTAGSPLRLPEAGDEVLVAFDHGDVRHPYVLGAIWSGREAPPR